MTTRLAIGAAGGVAAAYGGLLLVDRPLSDLVWIVVWLAAGVALHDAVLAPLSTLAGVQAHRWLPWAARGPVVVAAVVLVPLTLLAIPVLGRFGASPDNPTLLDRNYVAGWLAVVGLVVVVVAVGSVVQRWRRPDGADPGR